MASIIHDVQHARRILRAMQQDKSLYHAFERPANLSIFTAHNYPRKSLLERSLDFLGIQGYVVINKPVSVWSNSQRIRWFVDYLERECRTPLVLYCDADDVILRDDPRRIVNLFERHDCDVLYCSTRWPHGYKCIPEIRRWADSVHRSRYLNGGAFTGRREFVLELYRRVLEYVTPDDSRGNDDSHAFYRAEKNYANRFPKGVGCDQAILRFLEPQFYPRLKIDADNTMFWRNDNRTPLDHVLRAIKRSTPNVVKSAIKRITSSGSQ